MKKVPYDSVSMNDILDALYKIHQCEWNIRFNDELTSADRAKEIKKLIRQIKELSRAAKCLKENFYNDCLSYEVEVDI